MSRPNVARWWSGYVRSRNSARLARYQPTHKQRLQRAARVALWLQACVCLILLAAVLSGCASIPGVVLTDNERAACESSGCTVWTQHELEDLVRRVFRNGYGAGRETI